MRPAAGPVLPLSLDRALYPHRAAAPATFLTFCLKVGTRLGSKGPLPRPFQLLGPNLAAPVQLCRRRTSFLSLRIGFPARCYCCWGPGVCGGKVASWFRLPSATSRLTQTGGPSGFLPLCPAASAHENPHLIFSPHPKTPSLLLWLLLSAVQSERTCFLPPNPSQHSGRCQPARSALPKHAGAQATPSPSILPCMSWEVTGCRRQAQTPDLPSLRWWKGHCAASCSQDAFSVLRPSGSGPWHVKGNPRSSGNPLLSRGRGSWAELWLLSSAGSML